MRQIEDNADRRQKAWCIHCGGWITQLKTNKDHAPSKVLLDKPFPENLPLMKVCQPCNQGFAEDEEYVGAFLGAVLAGSTEPEKQVVDRAATTFRSNPALRGRVERAKRTYMTHGGDERVYWVPEEDRVRNVILKNARGHAYFEISEPMLEEPTHIWFRPLLSMKPSERDEFEEVGWPSGLLPEVGSRMMTRVMTFEDLDDGWVVVQDDVYRYAVRQEGRMLVRIVMREYLAAEVFWD